MLALRCRVEPYRDQGGAASAPPPGSALGRRPGTGAQHDRSGTTLWRIDSLIAAISVALPGMRVLPVKAIVFPADSPRSTTMLQKTRRIDEPTMGLRNREA